MRHPSPGAVAPSLLSAFVVGFLGLGTSAGCTPVDDKAPKPITSVAAEHAPQTWKVPGKPVAVVESANPSAAAPEPDAMPDEALIWKKPDAWQEASHPSAMRKATYKVPRAKGDTDDAELSVSEAGGDLDSNVKRWSGQFKEAPEPKRTDVKAGKDLKVTLVELEGTYTGMASMAPDGAPPDPKAGYALLAAIVEVPGADPYFFKLTGPKSTVAAARPDFDKLVASFAKK